LGGKHENGDESRERRGPIVEFPAGDSQRNGDTGRGDGGGSQGCWQVEETVLNVHGSPS
jgi:hypothetical protein